jgi:hypothetical protein
MEITLTDAIEVASSTSPISSVPVSPASIPVSSRPVTLLSTDPGAWMASFLYLVGDENLQFIDYNKDLDERVLALYSLLSLLKS